MYVPCANAVEDPEEVRALVAAVGSAHLVTVGPDGFPLATLLPVLWDGDRLLGHLARANDHWRAIRDAGPQAPGLAVVTGPEAYVSPSWYAAKAEQGRVVPTWNYTQVQLVGGVEVHDDPEWLLDLVTRLTQVHEADRPVPWAVGDAPAAYVRGQLRAIVGVELHVERVEAKAKLSQNRSAADVAGVVAGLRADGTAEATAVAGQVERAARR
ncbi:MAG: transcriptional regulator [Marmoricola sp.]|nr:transcriptional regulator [Marmoricola sp.]